MRAAVSKSLFWLPFLMTGTAMGAAGDAANNEITLKQNFEKPWRVGEKVCTEDKQRVSRCGKIVRVQGNSVVLRLSISGKGIEIVPATTPMPSPAAIPTTPVLNRGRMTPTTPTRRRVTPVAKEPGPPKPVVVDKPALDPPKPQLREVAAAPVSTGASETRVRRAPNPPLWNVGLGISVGVDFTFPMLYVERRVLPHVTIGGMPFYTQGTISNTQVTALGFYLTTSYYFWRDTFDGPLIQGGMGYNAITSNGAGETNRGSSISISGIIGWRVRPFWTLTMLWGAGGVFATRITGDPTKIDFSGAYPAFLVQLGFAF